MENVAGEQHLLTNNIFDCQDFYIGKTKRRLHDRKTEHFKTITSNCHASAIADHVTSTGHIFDTNL